MTHTHAAIIPSLGEPVSWAKPTRVLTPYEQHRILRINEVFKLLGCSKSTLYNYLNPSSEYYKPDFPKPIKLSARSIGWKAADIYAYIDSLQRKGV